MANFETSENLPKYFRTITKLNPLSVKEEQALGARIKAGDLGAVHELVRHNLKLVVTIANRHLGQGVPIDDLIQEGNIGLYEAAQRYDPHGDARFIAYAQLWIRKRINEAVASFGRIVRIPHNQEYERYLAKRAGEEVEDLRPVNLDQRVGDEGEATLGDMILRSEPEVDLHFELDGVRFEVRRAISSLKARDQGIIKAYFGIDRDYEMPTDAIAEHFGMTNVRVCQIVKASIQKMKETI